MKYDVNSAISYIEDFTWSKTRLGLDRTRELLERLGNPQERLKFIHVAGSNGKGSTCAMVSGILKEAGFKTGLYTSPYLVDFREQLQINGEMIAKEELAKIVEIVAPVADAMEDHPSRFEILTACGMLFFSRNNCDIVVIEVGMGGEMDSTNVIPPPIVACITNVGLEHTEYLGSTVEEITNTKIGIIKVGSRAVCYDASKKVVSIIKHRCNKLEVPLKVADFSQIKLINMTVNGMAFKIGKRELEMPLIGEHQLNNATTALGVIDELRVLGYEISEDNIKIGFKKVNWPARFHVLNKQPLFIIDGAHNPQGVHAVTKTLKTVCFDVKFKIMLGLLSDKDYEGIINMLIPFAEEFICVMPDNARAMPAGEVAFHIGNRAKTRIASSVREGLTMLLKEETPSLVIGSLYMAGEVFLKIVSAKKDLQRKICMDKRRAMNNNKRMEASHIICKKLMNNEDIRNAKFIFSYLALFDEVDLEEFHVWARKMGKVLSFPVASSDGTMEAYSPNSEKDLKEGIFGISSPIPEKSKRINPDDVDVIIVPCVGFDDDMRRLGHGMGYYDRYLPKLSKAKKLAVGFSEQRLPYVVTDEYDIVMDDIISED